MTDLKPRQRDVLRFLVRTYAERGRPASVRDVMGEFGWRSTNAVMRHVHELLRKGYLRYAGDGPVARGLLVAGLDERIREVAREYLAAMGE